MPQVFHPSRTMKPYYEDTESGITIYHGDCRDILRMIPDNSFHLVLSDPPFKSFTVGE